MSSAGDRLRGRFAGLRVRVVVEEWRDILELDSQGEPAIYAKPFTLADSALLQREIELDSPEGFATVVMTKSETEQGERVFDLADRQVLLQCCEAHIVSRVGRELMASLTFKDAEGN